MFLKDKEKIYSCKKIRRDVLLKTKFKTATYLVLINVRNKIN